MKTIAGFAILTDQGHPLKMGLSEDITAGSSIDEPFPIFDDKHDAERAFNGHCGMYGGFFSGNIVEVEVTVKQVIKAVDYNEEEDGEESSE